MVTFLIKIRISIVTNTHSHEEHKSNVIKWF